MAEFPEIAPVPELYAAEDRGDIGLGCNHLRLRSCLAAMILYQT
jgi:hypothetical protein